MASLITPLNISVPIVDKETGNPTPYFQQLLQKLSSSTALTSTNGVLGLADKSVTYAKIQDITATKRVLGRNTAAAGVAEEVTLSQLLDWVGTAARGDVLYRGASTWARLPAGTAGQVLTTQGTAADPTWTTPASGGAGATPTVRSSNVTSFNAATTTISFPAGTIAGDVVLICAGHGYAINLPTGWTSLQATSQGNFNGAVFAKVMTAGDITTGNVTITQTGSFYGVIVLVTLTGTTVTSLVPPHPFVTTTTGGSSNTVQNTSVRSGNLLIGISANRAPTTPTDSLLYDGIAGTTLQTGTSTEVCVLVSSITVAVGKLGGVTGVGSFTTSGSGNFVSLIGVS